jgi:hypothetical protein
MVSLTNVKLYLKISGTSLDTLLTNFINQAQTEIEKFINKNLDYGSKTIYKKVPKATTLLLIEDNVNSLTSVSYRDSPLDSWTAISSTLYALTLNDNYFIYYDSFAPNVEYKVVYNGGWSAIPDDLQSVAIEMVAIKLNESSEGKSVLGVQQIANGFSGNNETTTFADLFERRWKRILNKYKVYYI